MPRPSVATVSTQGVLTFFNASREDACGMAMSDLLNTTTAGTCRVRSSRRMASSNSPQWPASATISPRSVRSSTWRVFWTRSSPRAPTSSMPAVSMNNTGPSGSSSIGFSTGSVVVPATSETIDTCCRVKAFNSDDLPAFLRPNNPMCRRKPLGVFLMVSPRNQSPGRGLGAVSFGEPNRITRSGDVRSSNSLSFKMPWSTTRCRRFCCGSPSEAARCSAMCSAAS